MRDEIMREFGLTFQGATKVVYAIDRRRAGGLIRSQIALYGWALGVPFAWITAIRLTDGGPYDVVQFLDWFGFVGATIISYSLFFFLGPIVGRRFQRRIRGSRLRAEVRRCLETPCCIWCAYDLRALRTDAPAIRCPECGHDSPVREHSVTPAPASAAPRARQAAP